MNRFQSTYRGIALSLLAALLTPAVVPADDTAASSAAKKEAKPDSLIAKQQVLFERLNVAEAWKVTKGDPKVLIGIIDNGFDFFHPDLKGQLIPGYYYPGGYHAEFYENMAHGTLVSSIMVARDNNPNGMVGLAPGCHVLTASQGMIEHLYLKMQIKFFQEHPKATFADMQKELAKQGDKLKTWGQEWVHYQVAGAANAIHYLVDHDAKVINISSGMQRSMCPSKEVWQKLEDAFAYAAQKQVVIVLGAGNNAAQWEEYPGKPETMLVVGATLLNDTRWQQEDDVQGTKFKQGSNFGQRLSVMAPVENLVVCTPHEERFYACKDGPMGPTKLPFQGAHEVRPIGATSSAAPIVTSLMALILSAQPNLDAKSVVQIVEQGCDDIGKKGHDIYTGFGRVNFGKSMRLARDWKR